jgi:hypothetical protein
VSSNADTLEPDGSGPLPDRLARPAAAVSPPDQASAPAPRVEGEITDIVRQAELAIAGVTIGPVGDAGVSAYVAAWRRRISGWIATGASMVGETAEVVRGAVAARGGAAAMLRRFGTELRRRVRLHESAARSRLAAIGARPNGKLYAALGAVALGLGLGLISLHGRIGLPTSLSSAFSGKPAKPAPSADATAGEDRPAVAAAAEAGREFSRANIRYCTFQQIRLEALGPVTEGADLVVFNALVEDWNARCTRFRYRAADKDAVDAEAAGRRALLEVEGRALMNGWRRKIVTTVQQRPASADPETSENVPPAREAVERLPLLITLGRSSADEAERDTGLRLRTPSLALLRGDIATRVQRRLNDLGYTISPVDGAWGTMSRNALRRFKEANGLLGNDAFDAETVTRLFSTSAVTAASAGQRDAGTATIETAYPAPPGAAMNPLNRSDGQRIQQRLSELGYYAGHGDGGWGAASRNALRSFKVANGLSNDEDWSDIAETVLFDEQAVRAADATVGSARSSVAPTASAAVPLPPKRPPPPATAAKTTESAPSQARASPRPPGAIPAGSARAPAAALRSQ